MTRREELRAQYIAGWYEKDSAKLTGAAVVKTRDDGVFLERITYFKR